MMPVLLYVASPDRRDTVPGVRRLGTGADQSIMAKLLALRSRDCGYLHSTEPYNIYCVFCCPGCQFWQL
jgi:hypothetical protein